MWFIGGAITVVVENPSATLGAFNFFCVYELWSIQ